MGVTTYDFFRTVKFLAIGFLALILMGVVTVMVLARNTDEDITGVVAPGFLLMIVSGTVAIATAVFQRRASKAMGR